MCVWTDASFRKQGSLKAHTRVIRLTLIAMYLSPKENVNAKIIRVGRLPLVLM